MSRLKDDQMPVIIGIGEVSERPSNPLEGHEPLELMAEAARKADADAGGGFLTLIDALLSVRQATWRYQDAAAQLSELLGIKPSHLVNGAHGGESPIRLMTDAAQRIARSESKVALIIGAEAQYTLNKARQTKATLAWRPLAPKVDKGGYVGFLNPVAHKHKMVQPMHIYPLYESATQAAWEQTPAEAQAESGRIWANLANVATHNPLSWSARAYTPEEITTAAPDNRLISWPYTKRMVANPAVNLGAAVLLTSRATALQAGIPKDRLIYVWAGAGAIEPRDYLQRDQFARAHAQDVVLETLMSKLENGKQFDHVELYSCFPVVPKMARRTLGLNVDAPMTVTGGLSFFGAPLNNYMTHAAIAMTRILRQEPDSIGLLYGQGEFVTKHNGLIVASTPPAEDWIVQDYSLQDVADARRGRVPEILTSYSGPAKLEASTVIFDAAGAPLYGEVIAAAPQGGRLMARVPEESTESLSALMDMKHSPVGLDGQVHQGADDILEWTL